MKIGLHGFVFGSTKDRVSQYTTFCIQALIAQNPTVDFVLYVSRKQKMVFPRNCQVVVLESPTSVSRKKWEKQVMNHETFRALNFFHSFQTSDIHSKTVPCGITFHSTLILKPKKYIWQTLRERIRLQKEVKQSALIITVTDVLRKVVSHDFSIPLDKIRVVPGAADAFFQKAPDLAIVKEVQKNFSRGHDFLLYVGKVRKTGHIRAVLTAFAQIVSEPRFLKLKLIITGRTPFHRDPLYVSEPELQKVIQELGISGSVLLPGPIKREQLCALYKLSRGVVCDTADLGFPASAFEAALVQAPMLIPNTPSYGEFFQGDFLTYDTKNPKSLRLALAILADTAISKSEQTSKAQMVAHSYSWLEAASSLMRAISEVVEKNS